MGQVRTPLEFLISSSNNSLEEFELARLNQVSNLRKELRQIVDEWVESEVDNRIARWILDCRRTQSGDEQFADLARMEPVRGRQLAMLFAALPPGGSPSFNVAEAPTDGPNQGKAAAAAPKLPWKPRASGVAGKIAARPSLPPSGNISRSTLPEDVASALPVPGSQAIQRAPAPEIVRPMVPAEGILGRDEDSSLRALFHEDARPGDVKPMRKQWNMAASSVPSAIPLVRKRKWIRSKRQRKTLLRRAAGSTVNGAPLDARQASVPHVSV